MNYNLRHCLHPSEEWMRMAVVQNQYQMRKWGSFLADRSEKSPLTEYDLIIASHTRNIMGRLCGDLDKLYKHID